MAKYEQYKSVVLKNGQRGTIVEVFEPDGYIVDIGYSPTDWETLDVTENAIFRYATEEEEREDCETSKKALKEQGLWREVEA